MNNLRNTTIDQRKLKEGLSTWIFALTKHDDGRNVIGATKLDELRSIIDSFMLLRSIEISAYTSIDLLNSLKNLIEIIIKEISTNSKLKPQDADTYIIIFYCLTVYIDSLLHDLKKFKLKAIIHGVGLFIMRLIR